ncbi:hypothetical protein CYLTODRAFT_486147 [Cylindrobasidium torrendii FP15055 ss-10]|uniref:F-box domain-containing protein n=1 Tax=Cylindrobasidium torrendii FP15055 ss-10 TaxID=1314674 RepID=A0A0D7BRB6_9AGAR|nr:hypothetical protein CYLTODRAFT_486147 [Cylindrobasidium torrendii FP15055 ss-10]
MKTLPPAFIAQSVRKLCLTVSVKPSTAAQILSACPNVDGLALWVDFWTEDTGPPFPLAPLISSLPLRSLSVPVQFFQDVANDPMVQQNICSRLETLDLVFWEADTDTQPPLPLHILPRLYRLGIVVHENLPQQYLLSLTSQCVALRVASVLADDHVDTIRTEDFRIVFQPYPDVITLDWEALVRGNHSSWTDAEAIVDARRMEIARAGGTLSFLPLSLPFLIEASREQIPIGAGSGSPNMRLIRAIVGFRQ